MVKSRNQPGTGDPRRHAMPDYLWLAAALVCLAAWRISGLAVNGTDLFVDEAQYWAWSRELSFGYYSKPPLLAWIIAGATGICGDGEFCVRLPSVLFHMMTSVVVFLIGREIYSSRVGLFAALGFATMPGIALSSGIISTDVPLLTCWAVALLAFVRLIERPTWTMSLVLGVALGLGLNAKYAMAYFIPCAAFAFIVCPEYRSTLRRPQLWAALLIGAAFLVPNLVWNASNGYATLTHTAENASWGGGLFHPHKATEFFFSQFGVFGPILFGGLVAIVWRARRGIVLWTAADRVMLAFSVPIVAAVTVQGLLSHALANWGAPAYIAGVILVTAVMVREGSWRWLSTSLAIGVAASVIIPLATWQAGKFRMPGAGDPFARTLGNRETADVVRKELRAAADAGRPFTAILSDDRDVTAALLYYGRDLTEPVYARRSGGAPRNHFELTRPFPPVTEGRVLIVSPRSNPAGMTQYLPDIESLGMRSAAAGNFSIRTLHLFAGSSAKGN